MNYQSILIATDGSKAAGRAVPHAVELASTYGATLHALFVVDLDAVDVSLGTEQVQRLKEGRLDEMGELKEQAKRAMNRVREEAEQAGVNVEEAVAAGTPHTEIVEYAQDHELDLVVMTCHGHSGVKRMLLGSVTEKVLRKATMPVLVVSNKGGDEG